MKPLPLFRTRNGTSVNSGHFAAALEAVGAADCELLFMHTGLTFGMPNPELPRAVLLRAIYETISALRLPTLCVPTFTFSFCNGQNFDVAKSKSRMGALNEFIRQLPEAIRSADPLMSVALVGRDRELLANPSEESIGADSTFDRLSHRRGVKFLFLGELPGDCFTYMHHLEWKERVPYRYDRNFKGLVTAEGATLERTATLFVRYNGVVHNRGSHAYAGLLAQRGILRVAPLGDSQISCVAEPEAKDVYIEQLRRHPDFFIERPFLAENADTTFVARDMVAL